MRVRPVRLASLQGDGCVVQVDQIDAAADHRAALARLRVCSTLIYRDGMVGRFRVCFHQFDHAGHGEGWIHQAPLTVRIVDLATGRTTMTMQTAADVLGIEFDDSGRYFALLRQASVVELWQRDLSRRELRPPHSLADSTSTPWHAALLDGDGHYIIAANNSVRIYKIGQQAPVDSYEFGHPASGDQQSQYLFISMSRDGRTVVYADQLGMGGALTLDSAPWERDLCRIIGYRDFTADEQASLPASTPAQQVCPR